VLRFVRRSGFVGLVVLLAGAGCGDSSVGTVTGTVTLDGQPLQQGTVRFVPADGKSQPAGAEVKDGKFTASVPVGVMQVEFSAAKVVGKRKMYDTPDSPVVEETAEILPERYNVKTELKITVKAGNQAETFDLKSK
jgi:hypothetical protein